MSQDHSTRTTCRGSVDGTEKGLWQIHRHIENQDHPSLGRVLARHDPSNRSRSHRVLWYNTQLLRPFWVGVPGSGRTLQLGARKAGPDADHRRTEIGAAIEAIGFGIAGLCELWNDDDRIALLREIPRRESSTGVRTPSTSGSLPQVESLKGSGLVTLTRGPDSSRPHIVRDEHTTFTVQGEPFRDTDFYSQKGVLLTEIDLGPGHVDVYTTHLISGGGVPDGIRAQFSGIEAVLSQVRGGSIKEIRGRQIHELTEFVADTHRPENPALVLGDFNVEANLDDVDAEYQRLLEAMYALGLQDTWLARGSPRGATYDPEQACVRDSSAGPAGPCEDYPADPPADHASHRIDYIFLEFPSPHHSFHLDIGRIRRASFWRGDDNDPAYLSDHLGLEFTLFASPR
jgi:endonuclease/exonuclease/phosphatase family metal-dependent hydrolase